MKSETWTVHQLFQDRRQYRVPFYQRPYVWSREEQWEPLWADIAQKADDRLEGSNPAPHFLGAIVLEPQPRDGLRGVETLHIIDGQQRLTTLQYVLAALSLVIRDSKADGLLPLVEGCVWNPHPDTMQRPEIEKFKVWPTFRDREAYQAALTATTLEDLRTRFAGSFTQAQNLRKIGVDHPASLEAIWYFRIQIDGWLGVNEDKAIRLERLAEAILKDIKLVLISLEAQDDAQVVFETLNGRGAELHATDLIRNFVFMRADRDGIDAAGLYDTLWREFENPFWAEPQRRGRLRRPRLEWFMQSTLQAEVADDVDVGKLYDGYRKFVMGQNPPLKADRQLEILRDYADKYRQFVTGSGPDAIARFGERIAAWDASPVHAVGLAIAVSGATAAAQEEMFADILSYVVRRAICGLTPKNYNQVFLQVLKRFKRGEINPAVLKNALSALDGDASRWPRDDEFRRAWLGSHLLSRLGEVGRIRAVFWNLENELRSERSEERIPPDMANLDVEHILPDSWAEHWPLNGELATKEEIGEVHMAELVDEPLTSRQEAIINRDRLKHTIGNLTLLHYGVNRSLQNAEFLKKRERLFAESNLHLNRALMRLETWDEAAIDQRGRMLFEAACRVWRGPAALER